MAFTTALLILQFCAVAFIDKQRNKQRAWRVYTWYIGVDHAVNAAVQLYNIATRRRTAWLSAAHSHVRRLATSSAKSLPITIATLHTTSN